MVSQITQNKQTKKTYKNLVHNFDLWDFCVYVCVFVFFTAHEPLREDVIISLFSGRSTCWIQQDIMAHITINQYLQQVTSSHVFFCRASLTVLCSLHLHLLCLHPVGVFQVNEAIENHEGLFCAELLSFKHPHVANPRLQVRLLLVSDPRASPGYILTCVRVWWGVVTAGEPRGKMSAAPGATVWWDGGSSPQVGQLVTHQVTMASMLVTLATHLNLFVCVCFDRCTYAVANHDFVEAYKFQTLVVQYPLWW